MVFLSYLVNGLSLGSVYAIIALGYTMVYGIAKMLNFAHGDVIMVGAYISFCVTQYLKLPPIVSIVAAVIVCTALGLLVWGPSPAAPVLAGVRNALLCVGLVVISGFLPALLYSLGLRGEEAGRGAVMASIEPVVASMTGFVAFRETPTPLAIVGVVLVLAAVLLLNLGGAEKTE